MIGILKDLFQGVPDWVFTVGPVAGFAVGVVLALLGVFVAWERQVREGVVGLNRLKRYPAWVADTIAVCISTAVFWLASMTVLGAIVALVLAALWSPVLWVVLAVMAVVTVQVTRWVRRPAG